MAKANTPEAVTKNATPAKATGAKAPAEKAPVVKETKHIVTADDLINNPGLSEQGIKEGDEIGLPENGTLADFKRAVPPVNQPDVKEEKPKNNTSFKSLMDETMEQYKRDYPGEKKFYISTDGQVFLEKSHSDAKAHQAFLKEGSELLEYEV